MSDLLIVEDDTAMRDFLHQSLVRTSLSFRMAGDGARAIRLARERWPAALLLDLTLPGRWDGWQVWEALEAEAVGRSLNVILFAGELTGADQARAAQMGARAILPKPVQLAELLATLHCAVR